MAEPTPDIHVLFCFYNSLYFNDELGTCIVSWDPCLTSTEASLNCLEEGLCEIQLSTPLLKGRSSADLKNILLHEMIHAFLWIIHKNNSHSDHGPEFWSIANSINSNLKDDYQRPSNGYKITALHGFQNEEHSYSTYVQEHASFGDLTERGMDEEPSFRDCIEKNCGDSNCGNPLCGRHKHRKLCPGRCENADDFSGSKDKGKSRGIQGNVGRKPTGLSPNNRQDKRAIKRPRIMAEYLLPGDDKPKNSGKKPSQTECSNTNSIPVTDLRTRSLSVWPEIPRQLRTAPRKIYNLSNAEEIKCRKRGREISLVIRLFDVCTDEESEEDLHPLINRRSERRKRMKPPLNNSEGSDEQFAGLTTHEVISLD